jgi:hypothetical protein
MVGRRSRPGFSVGSARAAPLALALAYHIPVWNQLANQLIFHPRGEVYLDPTNPTFAVGEKPVDFDEPLKFKSQPMFIGRVSRKDARVSLYPTLFINQAVQCSPR